MKINFLVYWFISCRMCDIPLYNLSCTILTQLTPNGQICPCIISKSTISYNILDRNAIKSDLLYPFHGEEKCPLENTARSFFIHLFVPIDTFREIFHFLNFPRNMQISPRKVHFRIKFEFILPKF